jgi:hypothetical protein
MRALRFRTPLPLVVPVAVALDAVRAAGAVLWPLVSIVVVGTVAAQLLTSFRRDSARDRVTSGLAA